MSNFISQLSIILDIHIDQIPLTFYLLNILTNHINYSMNLDHLDKQQNNRLFKQLIPPTSIELLDHPLIQNICKTQTTVRFSRIDIFKFSIIEEGQALTYICLNQIKKKFYKIERISDDQFEQVNILNICEHQNNKRYANFSIFKSRKIYRFLELQSICTTQRIRNFSRSSRFNGNDFIEKIPIQDICKYQINKILTLLNNGLDSNIVHLEITDICLKQVTIKFSRILINTIDSQIINFKQIDPDDCLWEGKHALNESFYHRYLDLNDHQVDIAENILLDLEKSNLSNNELNVIIEFKEFNEVHSGAFDI